MFCSKCGNSLPDGALFCPNCAHPVAGSAPQTAVPPPAYSPASPARQAPKGWKPLRHPELPPTDREEADPSLVDLNAPPQVSAELWVGDLAKYCYVMCWVLLSMGCLVLLGCFSPFLPGLFFGTLLVQGLVVGGLLAARSSGYQKMRMGADWKTNSLWVHVDKQTRLTPDLNCVQDFTLVQRKRTTTTGTGLQKRTNTNYVYTLDALMSSGKAETVRGLPEMPKKKAEEVQRVARELLRRL